MASIKVCDRDGTMFIERAPFSVSISQGAIYDENGKAQPFSGEFCPDCGRQMMNTKKHFHALNPPVSYQDEENPKPDYTRIEELERENGIGR